LKFPKYRVNGASTIEVADTRQSRNCCCISIDEYGLVYIKIAGFILLKMQEILGFFSNISATTIEKLR
jgi:hypothetical protein